LDLPENSLSFANIPLVLDRQGKTVVTVRDVPKHFRDMSGKAMKGQTSDEDASDLNLCRSKKPMQPLPRRLDFKQPFTMASDNPPRKCMRSVDVEDVASEHGMSTLLIISNYKNACSQLGQDHTQKKAHQGHSHNRSQTTPVAGSSHHQLTAKDVVGPRRILMDDGYTFRGYQYQNVSD
jgi:hypothetical protein